MSLLCSYRLLELHCDNNVVAATLSAAVVGSFLAGMDGSFCFGFTTSQAVRRPVLQSYICWYSVTRCKFDLSRRIFFGRVTSTTSANSCGDGKHCTGRAASSSGTSGSILVKTVQRFTLAPRCHSGSERLVLRCRPEIHVAEKFPERMQRKMWIVCRTSAILISLSIVIGISEGASATSFGNLVAANFPWERVKEQSEPARGSCATCIGVVDDTLGACSATRNCVSSFDDRPMFFVAPWEFPGKLPAAIEELRELLLRRGATIKDQGERYIYAIFTGEDGEMDDVEFLFSVPAVDATVNIRAASRASDYQDNGRNRKRLEQIRMSLTWEQVPILRNRQRRLFFIESPWDTFGPEPPPSFDYKDLQEFAQE